MLYCGGRTAGFGSRINMIRKGEGLVKDDPQAECWRVNSHAIKSDGERKRQARFGWKDQAQLWPS